MFTGIIRYMGEIVQIQNSGQGKRLLLKADDELVSKMEKGITSVSIDGACHTVEDFGSGRFTVFSSFETLLKTTTGSLSKGSLVNLELPLTPVSLLDGHIVQGHVDGVGNISSIQKKGDASLFRFSADHKIIRYLVEKDSIAVDGISLTLFNSDDSSFQVAVIPETIIKTTLSRKREGDPVNLEINIFAKYAEKFLKEKNNKFESFFGKEAPLLDFAEK